LRILNNIGNYSGRLDCRLKAVSGIWSLVYGLWSLVYGFNQQPGTTNQKPFYQPERLQPINLSS